MHASSDEWPNGFCVTCQEQSLNKFGYFHHRKPTASGSTENVEDKPLTKRPPLREKLNLQFLTSPWLQLTGLPVRLSNRLPNIPTKRNHFKTNHAIEYERFEKRQN